MVPRLLQFLKWHDHCLFFGFIAFLTFVTTWYALADPNYATSTDKLSQDFPKLCVNVNYARIHQCCHTSWYKCTTCTY